MAHDLSKLAKFLNRGNWEARFEEIFENHFDGLGDLYEMEFEDLPEVLGEQLTTYLWTCAFEHFATLDFETDGNFIDDYLKRRGWTETPQNRVYMKALRGSIMSLYEVSEIVPGESLLARDLIRGGEPVLVSEKTGTTMIKRWDKMAARILPVMGKNVLAGGIMLYTPGAQDRLFYDLRRVFGRRNSRKLPHLTDEDLQDAGSFFTQAWLFDALDHALGISMPTLTNTDGDEIVFHDAHFPLAAEATQKAVAAGLDEIEELVSDKAKVWNWIARSSGDADGVEAKDGQGFAILGTIELVQRVLRLSTNSVARAEKGRAMIERALGGLVGSPLTNIRTLEQVMAEEDTDPENTELAEEPEPWLSPEEIHAILDQHYRQSLALPIGMLGNKTPRQALRSAAGRERVVEWLKYLENQNAHRLDGSDPMATYDFLWMWKELGIEHLRR